MDEIDTLEVDVMIEDNFYEDLMDDAYEMAELNSSEGWPYSDFD